MNIILYICLNQKQQVMYIETEKLLKISSYARKEKKSVQHIYHLSREGKIKVIEIDGVKFVEIKD